MATGPRELVRASWASEEDGSGGVAGRVGPFLARAYRSVNSAPQVLLPDVMLMLAVAAAGCGDVCQMPLHQRELASVARMPALWAACCGDAVP